MAKYSPLGDYLRTRSADSCTLSFAEIERIIDSPLPKSARQYATWWGNDKTHSHARAWIQVGWKARPAPNQIDPILFERILVDVFERHPGDHKGTTQVIVRNLDPRVVSNLKERAKRAGRSLEQELREILTLAARPSRSELLAEIDRIRAMLPGSVMDSTDILREDRSR